MSSSLHPASNKNSIFAGVLRNVLPSGSFGLGRGGHQWGPKTRVANADLLSVAEDTDALKPFLQLTNSAHALAEESLWDDLTHLITDLDQKHDHYGGKRLAKVGVVGAITPGFPPDLGHIEGGRIARFEDALQAQPDNLVLAAIVATCHMARAQVFRKRTSKKRTEYDAWVGYYHHIEQATEAMDRFDPLAKQSPLTARIKHRIATHHDYAPDEIDAAFERCMVLDPTDWETMCAHARALTYCLEDASDRIEVAARQAMARTEDVAGATAYAAFYFGVLDKKLPLIDSMDTELFMNGVNDMITQGGKSAYEINRVIAHLVEAQESSLQPVTTDLIRHHLRALVPACWRIPPQQVHQILAWAWKEPLSKGKRVHLSAAGITFDDDVSAA